jgi:pyrroloquinoline-quinone synthase
MDAAQLGATLAARLDGCRLLDHPFYQRWSRGEVSVEELRAYAAQYRHFEALLPAHLREVADSAADGAVREQALRNLADEAGTPPTHLELFDRFAAALDAPQADPSPAMTHLLDTYRDATASGAPAGFAAVLAYEMQAPGVSATKAQGLRDHGILTDDGALAFWDLHATLDTDHARWAVEALAESGADTTELETSVRSAATAWWGFLDEREALRA